MSTESRPMHTIHGITVHERENKFSQQISTVIVHSAFHISFGMDRFHSVVVLFIKHFAIYKRSAIEILDNIKTMAHGRLKLLISLMKWQVKWPLVNQEINTNHETFTTTTTNETKHIRWQNTKAHKYRFNVKCRPICQFVFNFSGG